MSHFKLYLISKKTKIFYIKIAYNAETVL